jgi:hypothetical protein
MNSWEHVTLGALSPGFSRHMTYTYGICTREFKETRRVVFPLCIHSILSDESLPWQKCSPTQSRPLHAYKNGDVVVILRAIISRGSGGVKNRTMVKANLEARYT